MFFFFVQFFFVKISESTWNSTCTAACQLPGMICSGGRCICDPQARFFWTGARCLSCPAGWQMSEIACIVYDRTKLTWSAASTSCSQVRADLISFRDESILPLLHEATGYIPPPTENIIAWTSAHLVDLTNKDKYQWSDTRLNILSNRSPWWCQISHTQALGYPYTRTDPTQLIIDGVMEQCVTFRRGRSSAFLCLDDVLCNDKNAFVCEKTEVTAKKFGESIVATTKTSTKRVSKSTARSNVSTTSRSTKSTGNNQLILGILTKPEAQKSDKNTVSLILIVAICLIMMSVGAFGIFYFAKWKDSKGIQFPKRQNQPPNHMRQSFSSDGNVSITADEDTMSMPDEVVHTPPNVDPQPEQKKKHGGYSKQQFDEYE